MKVFNKNLNVIITDKRKFDLLYPLRFLIFKYQRKLSKEHFKRYPQVGMFAFDEVSTRINDEGRLDDRSLCLIKNYLETIPTARFSAALDIGAHIGNHSIFFSEMFEEVFSFEPNPRTFALLNFNSQYINLKNNIKCFNIGLSDQNGRLKFKANKSTNTGNSYFTSESKEQDTETSIYNVDVKRIDDLLELCSKKISLIKIDVEGHELSVLKGAKELIKRNKPVILFEQFESEFLNGTSEVCDFLKGLNYSFLTIEENFYFGKSFVSRIAGTILRLVFGSQLLLVKRDNFERRYHDMIIAISK